VKLQNKILELLTATNKILFPSIFFYSFPEALGTSWPIFKLLGVTEVRQ